MQRNIDTFFKRVPNQKKSDDDDLDSPAPKKRKARVISSDEDEVMESPQPTKEKSHNKKSRTEPSPSPRHKNEKTSSNKKPALTKLKDKPALKKIDPVALFGEEPKRIEAKRPAKPKDQTVIELEDDDIDKSLMEVDLDESIEEHFEKPKSSEKQRKEKKQENKKTPDKKEDKKKTPEKPEKLHSKKEATPAKRARHDESLEKIKTEKTSKENGTPKPAKTQAKQTTPRAKHEDLESSVLTDEERHERKRMAAMLYQKFKNRSSCLNPGSKEVPKGKPDCLKGLTFLITGVLESLERDEAASIIKEYGGKTMTVVGKRLNYLIVGEDAGPKKLAQAEEFNVTILSEDGLFDLIVERSGGKVKKKPKIEEDDDEEEKTSPSPKNKKHDVKKEKVTPDVKESKRERKEDTKKDRKDENEKKIDIKVEKKVDIKKERKEEELNNNKQDTQSSKVSEDMLAWVDKYKPTSVKEIIGQQGAASNVTKLINWLSKWYINHDGKKKLQKPNPWAKNDDGSYYKAALLSGPPGIGKTTTATLVCKELGFDTVEFNASDTRSKRLLKEEVTELLSNKSLYGYFHGKSEVVTKKHVLIMDEVDGMAGNEDRGGIQELIALIKDSSVPIICMCNDRNHQKMRSLVNYCYDLRFNKPRLEQIKARILSICFKEKVKLEPTKIEEIITATNNDIRQSINHISLLSAGKDLKLKSDTDEKTAQKDLKMGPWEVVRKVFSADEHKNMSFYDKCDLFFHDYSLAPLFVQQNYLQVSPVGAKSDVLQKVANTADALSLGDLVDKRIRSNSAWSLLPTQAVFSSVMPGEYMCGHFTGMINFPGWLGKNSRANKRSRLAQEIHDHTRIRTSGSRLSVRLDYAPFLLDKIVRPMREGGMDGVAASLEVMKEYHLLREDIEALIELSTWPGKKSLMDAIDGRVKAALTRLYNKEVLAYSYSAQAGVKKKKAEAVSNDDDELLLDGEDGEAAVPASDEEDNDDVELDGLIKTKKKPAASAKTAANTSKAAAAKKTGGAAAGKAKPAKGGSRAKK